MTKHLYYKQVTLGEMSSTVHVYSHRKPHIFYRDTVIGSNRDKFIPTLCILFPAPCYRKTW